VVRRENAALTHEAYTSIQPEEMTPGGQWRECSFKALQYWLYFSELIIINSFFKDIIPEC